MTLLLQRLEGEHHVVGGDRAAVAELRLRPELEGHRHAVVGDLGALRDEAVDRVGFVRCAGHQRIEQEVEALRRVTLENEIVEAVEGGDAAPADQGEGAALRRVGIDVVEMIEVGGVGEIAEGREAVLRFRRAGEVRRARDRRDKRKCSESGTEA